MHELATVSLLPTDQVMLISMRAGRALSTPPRAVALPAQELQDAGSPLAFVRAFFRRAPPPLSVTPSWEVW